MSEPSPTLIRYLREAHAMELGLARVLQSQIAVAPRGSHRTALEDHLKETRSHAERVGKRLEHVEQARRGGLLSTGVDIVQGIAGQLLALSKTPLDLMRGHGLEEKVLKNAKDACAAEALEIATYSVLERLAKDVGDTATVNLVVSIRKDEEAMLQRLLDGLGDLTDAVAAARIDGHSEFDPKTSGAADTTRDAVTTAKRSAGRAASKLADPGHEGSR